jgi:hypothetical protein
LGASRALMLAFMLRVPGFEELDEHIVIWRDRNTQLPQKKRALYVTELLKNYSESDSTIRGGILSGERIEKRSRHRHAVAFVYDTNGQLLLYNWGVGGTRIHLKEFLKIYPENIEVVVYSLPSVSRRLPFDDVSVAKKKLSLQKRLLGRLFGR